MCSRPRTRPRPTASKPLVVLASLGVVLAMFGGACGNDEEASAEPVASAGARAGAGVDWSERFETASVDVLTEALGQSHATVRAAIGPHELQYKSSMKLVDPAGDGSAPEEVESAVEGLPPPALLPPGEAEVGEPVVSDQAVSDELRLRWAGQDHKGPRFSLNQVNDRDRGREVIAVDERIYTRMRHRSWIAAPVESDVWELWLDDAQRAPLDLVEFAAPRLSVTFEPSAGAGLGGGDAVLAKLALGEGTTSPSPTHAGQAWREGVQFEAVEGAITLDRRTGAWLSGEISLTYALRAADGRQLRGTISWSGGVEALAEAPSLAAPADASPVPERNRYEEERKRLLDGLAAP